MHAAEVVADPGHFRWRGHRDYRLQSFSRRPNPVFETLWISLVSLSYIWLSVIKVVYKKCPAWDRSSPFPPFSPPCPFTSSYFALFYFSLFPFLIRFRPTCFLLSIPSLSLCTLHACVLCRIVTLWGGPGGIEAYPLDSYFLQCFDAVGLVIWPIKNPSPSQSLECMFSG